METTVEPTPGDARRRGREVLAELADLACFEVDADRNVVAISPAMERLTASAPRR